MSRVTVAHHLEWLKLVEVSGPFVSLSVLQDRLPQGLEASDSALNRDLRETWEEWRERIERRPDPAADRGWTRFVLGTVLGFPESALREGQQLPPGLVADVREHQERLRPDLAVVDPVEDSRPGARDTAPSPVLLVTTVPAGTDLEGPVPGSRWKESARGRLAHLLRTTGVRLGLVTNGDSWTLVDAPSGGTTAFVTWSAELWLEEPLTLRAFRTLLGARRFFGIAQPETLAGMLEASAEHQGDVTDQLGRQVRRAVEILVQALDRADREADGVLLSGVDPRDVYSAAVTVMMRLVFLFAAEERKLLPVDDPIFADGYSASRLRDQLQDAADQWGEEVLELRSAAWHRLLATFRAVHGGVAHPDLDLPPYGGHLFDPNRFTFLEGRAPGTNWRQVPAFPVRINDRIVLHLLNALQQLYDRRTGESQRLSFRGLDIEQIGHVYEGLLDHTVRRAQHPVVSLRCNPGREADEPEVELKELERWQREGADDLVNEVAEVTGRKGSAIEKDLVREPELDSWERLQRAAGGDRALASRVKPFLGIVRTDAAGLPIVVPKGGLFVTKGSDRRSTGTHYTPRSLTEPIVRYALEPLVFSGPAEGKAPEEWVLRSAREILALRVCDLACGSGAFLVEACRYLSQRLVEAWETAESSHPGQVVVTPEGELSAARPAECLIPVSAEERLAVARRLVADRCLYGVDVNPMAVEMAKLSLWLVTLEARRPFTFLDHALKCGDSLFGVHDPRQISEFDLEPSTGKNRWLFLAEPLERALRHAAQKRNQLEAFPVRDVRDAEAKEQLLLEAEDAVAAVKLVGDLLVGAALAETPSRGDEVDYARITQLLQEVFSKHTSESGRRTRLAELREVADRALLNPEAPPRRPFHWVLEYPEVLGGRKGFDAFVGNPPFQGGKLISGALGSDYREALVKHVAAGKRGNADLAAYFFLRAGVLLRSDGVAGLLATNSICQGDTAAVGLQALCRDGFSIVRAVASAIWPGEAALSVSHVWMSKSTWRGSFVLDDQSVGGIGPFLSEETTKAQPAVALPANRGIAFIGSIVHGTGFLLDPTEAKKVLAADSANADVLFPYLNGEDVNYNPDYSASRWAINFDERSEREARKYRAPWKIVEERVRPERLTKDARKYPRMVHEWWKHWNNRRELAEAISSLGAVLVISRVSAYHAVVRVHSRQVFSERLVVFATEDLASLAILNSTVHETWARRPGATTHETRGTYFPGTAFETFPLPPATAALRKVGAELQSERLAWQKKNSLGVADLCGLIHEKKANDSAVRRIRELVESIDLCVLDAYGWSDLRAHHGFVETRSGPRFSIQDPARSEIVARLHQANAAAVASADGKPGRKVRRSPRRSRPGSPTTLFD